MTIAGITSSPFLALNTQNRAGNSAAAAFLPAASKPANSAGGLTILPSANPVQLSIESLVALQSEQPKAEEASVTTPSVEDQFLEEARKSPMERMREQIMKELGVSEQDLAQMPADERRAMEDRIRELVEEKLRQAMNAGKDAPSSNGEMLQQLL